MASELVALCGPALPSPPGLPTIPTPGRGTDAGGAREGVLARSSTSGPGFRRSEQRPQVAPACRRIEPCPGPGLPSMACEVSAAAVPSSGGRAKPAAFPLRTAGHPSSRASGKPGWRLLPATAQSSRAVAWGSHREGAVGMGSASPTPRHPHSLRPWARSVRTVRAQHNPWPAYSGAQVGVARPGSGGSRSFKAASWQLRPGEGGASANVSVPLYTPEAALRAGRAPQAPSGAHP